MNPTNAPRPEMRYPFFQNFDKIEVEDMLPKEYELIPQLKPGPVHQVAAQHSVGGSAHRQARRCAWHPHALRLEGR